MSDTAERVESLRARLAAAAKAAGRSADRVRLLAVSKTFGPERVAEAAALGLRAFGENRVQEGIEKIPAVAGLCPDTLEWHFIGQLQRNKASRAVERFDVIQSVDRIALARALERAASEQQRQPSVLLQVKLDAEASKGGVAPQDLLELAEQVAALPHLRLAGLMAIPDPRPRPDDMRPAFARLRELSEQLRMQHPGADELSMGMSADFEVAIAEGATWIRIGTGIFGERNGR